MLVHNVKVLKIACLLLFIALGWRVADGLATEIADPSAELTRLANARKEAHQLASEPEIDDESVTEETEPTLRPVVAKVAESSLFGVAPPPPPPSPNQPPKAKAPKLQGIAADFAILEIPGRGVHMIRLGDEEEGVKVLKLALNRVLIEVDGVKHELTIYSGFGSDPLLKPEEDQ